MAEEEITIGESITHISETFPKIFQKVLGVRQGLKVLLTKTSIIDNPKLKSVLEGFSKDLELPELFGPDI